ncbi:MAG: hypothetical protein V1750_01860 [Acidobacteriota bacterium]
MSGPVWRHEPSLSARCDACQQSVTGIFVEGEIRQNEFAPRRRLCPDCYRSGYRMEMRGEGGRRIGAPGYTHRA